MAYKDLEIMVQPVFTTVIELFLGKSSIKRWTKLKVWIKHSVSAKAWLWPILPGVQGRMPVATPRTGSPLILLPVKSIKEIWGYFHSDYYPESTDYTSDFGNYSLEYASPFDALDAVYELLDDQPTGLKTSQSKIWFIIHDSQNF